MTGTWTCPVHGLAVETVSRKGRHYLSCPTCIDFERDPLPPEPAPEPESVWSEPVQLGQLRLWRQVDDLPF